MQEETPMSSPKSATRRTTLHALGAGAAGMAMPAIVRAQDPPVRVGYAIARTGPWAAGAQVTQEPNYLLWADQQNAAGGSTCRASGAGSS